MRQRRATPPRNSRRRPPRFEKGPARALPDPTFGGPEPLTVQVHKSGGGMCTQSVFRGVQIKQNDAGGFSGKTP